MAINRRNDQISSTPFKGANSLLLTGKETGPELKYLLPLLSRKTILNRLGSKE